MAPNKKNETPCRVTGSAGGSCATATETPIVVDDAKATTPTHMASAVESDASLPSRSTLSAPASIISAADVKSSDDENSGAKGLGNEAGLSGEADADESSGYAGDNENSTDDGDDDDGTVDGNGNGDGDGDDGSVINPATRGRKRCRSDTSSAESEEVEDIGPQLIRRRGMSDLHDGPRPVRIRGRKLSSRKRPTDLAARGPIRVPAEHAPGFKKTRESATRSPELRRQSRSPWFDHAMTVMPKGMWEQAEKERIANQETADRLMQDEMRKRYEAEWKQDKQQHEADLKQKQEWWEQEFGHKMDQRGGEEVMSTPAIGDKGPDQDQVGAGA